MRIHPPSGAAGPPSRSDGGEPRGENLHLADPAVATPPPSIPPGFGAGVEDPESSKGRGAKAPRKSGRARSPRKRGSRGGRRTQRKQSAEPTSGSGDGSEATAPAEEARKAEPTRRRSRRRGKRGGRRRRTTDEGPAVEIEAIPGEDDDLPEPSEQPDGAERATPAGAGSAPAGRGSRRSRGRKAAPKRKAPRRKAGGRAAPEEEPDESRIQPDPGPRTGKILVNAADPEEVRVAVVEDGRIVDLQMTVKRHSSYVNDIYRGRVVNLEPAIGAAFVDFGQGRNGFLHASDVLACYGEEGWKLENLLTTRIDEDEWGGEEIEVTDAKEREEGGQEPKAGKQGRAQRGRPKGGRGRPSRRRLPIEKLVKKGQMVVVQITKDAIGDKGPTLTTYISIPGRYLVLMPSLARTGVSRKIEDEKERKRLKRILQSLDVPAGMGVIVRTAGVGRTKAEIKRDLEYLLLAWADFSRLLVSGRNPAPLYQESDVSVRTMRDLFGNQIESVLVDDPEVHERIVEFTKKLMPENVERIHLHDGSRPVFHANGVEQDFERIFQRRIELPSGGSIVFDQTEALVAIDVNSGKTRGEGADFEDIALKTNLEAAPEIARQIRLRDLGGIIVLDFIDMMRMGNRRIVEKAFREALARDRARSKVGRISQFGLLELTRQRLGPGLSKLIFDNCQQCRGSGRRRSAPSRAQAILRRLGAALQMKGFSRIEVRAHADVIRHIETTRARELDRLRSQSSREIALTSVRDQIEDSVLRYLRADGREVRPGGRRKR